MISYINCIAIHNFITEYDETKSMLWVNLDFIFWNLSKFWKLKKKKAKVISYWAFPPPLFFFQFYLCICSHIKGNVAPYGCMCAQSCSTLCATKDYSPSVSYIYEIFQARILGWVTISYSRRSSQPREWTHVSYISYIDRQILYHCTTWEALYKTGKPKILFAY